MASESVISSIEGVVVWEWRDSYTQWQACESSLSNQLEDEHTKFKLSSALGRSGTVPCRFTITSRKCKHAIDFLNMFLTHVDNGKIRQIRRKIFPPESAFATGITWKFETDIPGEFLGYSAIMNNFIEQNYQQGNHAVDLRKKRGELRLPYLLDLRNMTQLRQTTGKVRKMLRQVSDEKYKFTDSLTIDAKSSTSVRTESEVTTSAYAAASSHVFSGLPSGVLSSLPPMSASVGFTFSAPCVSSSAADCRLGSYALPKKPTSYYSSSRSVGPSGSFPDSVNRGSSGTVFNGSMKADVEATKVIENFASSCECGQADEDCCICYEQLSSPSGFESEGMTPDVHAESVVKFNKCSHVFHKLCLVHMYNSGTKQGSVQCPSCKTIYGTKTGNCPPGRMDYRLISESLPGFEGYNTIHISYNIPSGVQGPNHPSPGSPYTAYGFPRQGFLPNNSQGKKVLKLLIMAFERGLTFTIGTSVTTSRPNSVVWNEIHHKTEFHDLSGHGYPDANYLENVTAELAAHGVVDDSSSDSS